MPIELNIASDRTVSEGEFTELFNAREVSTDDDDSLLACADLLASLHNNKSFMSKFLYDRVTDIIADSGAKIDTDSYTAQVFKIFDINARFYVRGVFWPSPNDELYTKTGSELFYYGKPHDHNFSFLTIGHMGPGYESDYYEISSDTSEWHPGCDVELHYIGRKQLSYGKTMLYRAHRDVHSQLPPPSSSVSLNIMPNSIKSILSRQYVFNSNATRVDAIIQRKINPLLFRLIETVGGDEVAEPLLHLYDHHDDNMVRFLALRSMALSQATPEDRIKVFQRGLQNHSSFISGWSKSYIDLISQPFA